jgi:hypothetical protein
MIDMMNDSFNKFDKISPKLYTNSILHAYMQATFPLNMEPTDVSRPSVNGVLALALRTGLF